MSKAYKLNCCMGCKFEPKNFNEKPCKECDYRLEEEKYFGIPKARCRNCNEAETGQMFEVVIFKEPQAICIDCLILAYKILEEGRRKKTCGTCKHRGANELGYMVCNKDSACFLGMMAGCTKWEANL